MTESKTLRKVQPFTLSFENDLPRKEQPKKSPQDAFVPLGSYIFEGVREDGGVVNEAEYFFRLDEEVPLPPEATITVYQAVTDLFAVDSDQSLVRRKVMEDLREYQALLRAKKITAEQFGQYRRELEAIRMEHALTTDETIHWYLQTHFRIFREIEPDKRKRQAWEKWLQGMFKEEIAPPDTGAMDMEI